MHYTHWTIKAIAFPFLLIFFCVGLIAELLEYAYAFTQGFFSPYRSRKYSKRNTCWQACKTGRSNRVEECQESSN